MRVLLPPSETKRPGGSGAPLDPSGLSLSVLAQERVATISALVALSSDSDVARRVLKLSERQAGDIAHNRALLTAPTMAAVDRYTGVLFDALDAASLDASARGWLGSHVWIHSAAFGPVGALDEIPLYRLSAKSTLPGVPPPRRHWADAVTSAIADTGAEFILDLRSEAYVALGPVPASVPCAYVRVVSEDSGGTRALNHFNKRAKGVLVRTLAEHRPVVRSVADLLGWAHAHGVRLRLTADNAVVELVVD